MFRQAITILGSVNRGKRSRRAATYQALADILSRNDSRLNEAVSLLRTIVKLEPEEAASYVMLGELLIRQNKTQEGKSVFEKTFKLFPRGLGLRYDAADACLMAQDLQCAEHLFALIVDMDKTQGMAMLKYGVLIAEKENATAEELIKSHK